MPAACRIGDPMDAGSITGVQETGSPNFFINGRPAARDGDKGSSTCPEDGGPYFNDNAFGTEHSKALFVNGKGIVRVGDTVNIHDHGFGAMKEGSPNFFVAR